MTNPADDLESAVKIAYDDPLDNLEEALDEFENALSDVIDKARELYRLARLAKTSEPIAGQIQGYLLGHLQNFMENERQPGSIPSLREMIADEREEE